MSIYFVRHQHSAESCPAKDPALGPMLLEHLSRTNARRFGVDVHADAVLDEQHSLVMIAEAEDESYVRDFMAPFLQAGSVDIMPASTCEAVVERRGCEPQPTIEA